MVDLNDLETRVWSDRGTKPAPGDETYTAGYQPIAAYDNWWNWAVSEDLRHLHDTVKGLDDIFVNTNRPDSTEVMQGPLRTPRLFVGNADGLEVFVDDGYWPNNIETDANTFRINDINNKGDVGFLFELFDTDKEERNELLSVRREDWPRNFHYREQPIYYGEEMTPTPKVIGTNDKPVEEIGTKEISHDADYICRTGDELLAALSSVSNGETIVVGDVVVDDWLDLDGVSNVTVASRGSSGSITVADGAEVGLFRLGQTTPVSNITIAGLELDGNDAGNNGNAQHAHGVGVYHGADVTVRDCHVHDTIDYSGDDSDTSAGIVSLSPSEDITIEDCRVEHTGYRGIETSATNVSILNNTVRNVIERHISLDSARLNQRCAQDVRVEGNWCKGGGAIGSNISMHGLDYSQYGVMGGAALQNITVEKNFFFGTATKRSNIACRDLTDDAGNIQFIDNLCLNPNNHCVRIETQDESGVADADVAVSGGFYDANGSGGNGIDIRNIPGAEVSGAKVRGAANGVYCSSEDMLVSGLSTIDCGRGVLTAAPGCTIEGGMFRKNGSQGIRVSAASTTIDGVSIRDGALPAILSTEPDTTIRNCDIDVPADTDGTAAITTRNNADNTLLADNRVRNPATAYKINGTVNSQDNNPLYTLAETTLTLPAAGTAETDFVDGDPRNGVPEAIVQPVESTIDTNQHLAVDWQFVFRSGARWAFELEWVTDPGTDVDFDVKILPVARSVSSG